MYPCIRSLRNLFAHRIPGVGQSNSCRSRHQMLHWPIPDLEHRSLHSENSPEVNIKIVDKPGEKVLPDACTHLSSPPVPCKLHPEISSSSFLLAGCQWIRENPMECPLKDDSDGICSSLFSAGRRVGRVVSRQSKMWFGRVARDRKLCQSWKQKSWWMTLGHPMSFWI